MPRFLTKTLVATDRYGHGGVRSAGRRPDVPAARRHPVVVRCFRSVHARSGRGRFAPRLVPPAHRGVSTAAVPCGVGIRGAWERRHAKTESKQDGNVAPGAGQHLFGFLDPEAQRACSHGRCLPLHFHQPEQVTAQPRSIRQFLEARAEKRIEDGPEFFVKLPAGGREARP